MSTPFQFTSLKLRLAIRFLAVTVFSLIAVVTIVYFQRADVISQDEFVKLQVVRDLKVMQLSNWIDQRMGDLEVAAGDDEIQVLENAFIADGGELNSGALSTARSLLQRYLDHYTTYIELFIVSASSGKVMVSTDASQEGLDKSTDLYFTEPVRTQQSYIKDIYYSDAEQENAMAFSVPIFSLNDHAEHLIGVLVARVNLDESLYPLLLERTGMGETGETLIVNQDGIALSELRWQEDAVLKLKIFATPAARAALGETGIVESPDYRGEQVLAAYTHIPQTGWGFVAKRNLAEVYAPIRSMLRSLLFAASATILLIVAVSVLIARSISNPVRKLTRAAARMASDETGVRVDIRTGDEIELLATAFNEMATRLDAARSEVLARDWLNTGMAELDDVIRGEKELSQLCTAIITKVARYLDIQVGTLSLADYEKKQLTVAGSYAYQAKPGAATTCHFGEGLVGQAALEKKRILVEDVSQAHITVTSALGELAPRSILCVPLLYAGKVVGVIELGSLKKFTGPQLQFLEQTAERLAISIHTAQSREALQRLLAARQES